MPEHNVWLVENKATQQQQNNDDDDEKKNHIESVPFTLYH